jgi:DedD protein
MAVPEQHRDSFQMDKALKERVIGVIVLVVFAVIIVPVFLDGPSNDTAVLSETLALPGQNSEARQQQTIVLDRDRDEPVPAATGQAAAQPRVDEPKPAATAPVAATPQPRSAPPQGATAVSAKADTAADSEKSETGLWAVQLGSFSNQQNAERLAAELRKQGYAAFLSQLTTGDRALHRVRIGPQKDRDSAAAVAVKLQAAGHASQVVPHP